jgi:hypothetical protein
MCPACLAAIVAAYATSGGGLWRLKQIAREAIGMKTRSAEARHRVGTRNEWLAARLTLLEAEKDATRR